MTDWKEFKMVDMISINMGQSTKAEFEEQLKEEAKLNELILENLARVNINE